MLKAEMYREWLKSHTDPKRMSREQLNALPVEEKAIVASNFGWKQGCIVRWDGTKVYGWFPLIFPGWFVTNKIIDKKTMCEPYIRMWDETTYLQEWEILSHEEEKSAIKFVPIDWPKAGVVRENMTVDG